MSHLGQAREVFVAELEGLRAFRGWLVRSFDAVVEILLEMVCRRGKSIVVGMRKSGNVGRKIAAELLVREPLDSSVTFA